MKRLATAVLFVLAACSPETTSIDLSNTQVELNVYSGRPNPSWQLTAEEAVALEERLRDLPPTTSAVPETGLGYRGFIVHDGGRRIEIGSGFIVVWRGEERALHEDRHAAEDYLFKTAVQRGYGALIATD